MAVPTESPNPNSESAQTADEPRPSVGFVSKAFASGLFSGYSPVASGTVGSAVGLAFYAIPGFEQLYVIVPLCVIVFFLGVKASDSMEKVYGNDPSEVTIDEVLGMWISLVYLPKRILVAVLAFLIFRLLDIVKPYPARRFDNVRGGYGVMLDDVISAIYTNLIVQLAVYLRIV
jgi:phosphatidylglycerophosphatase A